MSLGIECLSGELPYECDAYGDSGTFPPYLRVDYTLSGVEELATPHLLSPPFAFTPNPTSGRLITITYDIATPANLALRDALGRTTCLYSLDPSGRTQLDLRGFAPGVYIATLDGTTPLVSRKLVITAR